MSQTALATLSASLILVVLIAYAVLGGADFGGGIWDLLARGRLAERERTAIARGMGPVWESNNIWLIFVLVVTWTAYPIVFAAVSTALFIPITLALVGIVLRGASFSFRSNYGMQLGAGVRWGYVFGIASTITPFLLGTIAGALASGGIRVSSGQPPEVQANAWTTWTTPFALSCGAFALGLCSVLSATYLTVEVHSGGASELTETFRMRAVVAGAVTALIGAVAALLASNQAPLLWRGLTGKALPFSAAAILLGLATAAALFRDAYLTARVLVAAETACILVAWAVAQWPYLIVPDVTSDNAASPASVLGPMLVVAVLGLIIVLPSLWYLFYIFKRRTSSGGTAAGPAATTAAFVASLEPSSGAPHAPPDVINASRAAPLISITPAVRRMRCIERMLAFSVAVAGVSVIAGLSASLYYRLKQRRMGPWAESRSL